MNRPNLPTTAVVASLSVCAALVAAGCGSSSSSTATTSVAPLPTGKTSSVAVTVKEMSIATAPVPAAAGEVTFDVKNDGKLPHEMVVIKTDKKAADLGPADSKGQVAETGSQGETGDIAAGASKTLKLKLAKGHYALICNIPGHYAAGMHVDLTVS